MGLQYQCKFQCIWALPIMLNISSDLLSNFIFYWIQKEMVMLHIFLDCLFVTMSFSLNHINYILTRDMNLHLPTIFY